MKGGEGNYREQCASFAQGIHQTLTFTGLLTPLLRLHLGTTSHAAMLAITKPCLVVRVITKKLGYGVVFSDPPMMGRRPACLPTS